MRAVVRLEIMDALGELDNADPELLKQYLQARFDRDPDAPLKVTVLAASVVPYS